VALNAAIGLVPSSWRRAGLTTPRRARWIVFALLGAAAAATVGPFLVLVLVACGAGEVVVALRDHRPSTLNAILPFAMLLTLGGVDGIGALVWVAFKVGALSYGGGFVIIPLMQNDAVTHYHWMTSAQFLNAVALGQITPGPVVQTVAVVGYAAAGVGGALLGAAVAFAPSFAFIIGGGRHFDALRQNRYVQAFLSGAGPASIGAIAGSSLPLGLALAHLWQLGILAGALIWIVMPRRGVVLTLVSVGLLGVIAALVGLPIGG
jgi:chromate transporter